MEGGEHSAWEAGSGDIVNKGSWKSSGYILHLMSGNHVEGWEVHVQPCHIPTCYPMAEGTAVVTEGSTQRGSVLTHKPGK